MQVRLTGGASNSNVNTSLGGDMSSVEVIGGNLNNFWDNIGGLESRDGDTEYRDLAIFNAHGTATMLNTKVFILSNTTSPNDSVAIGLSTTPVGTGPDSINNGTNEQTVPSGVTFSESHTTEATALNIGDLTPGQRAYVWIRRTVQAGAAAQPNNSYTLRIICETV
jgi:hypothetical protein